MIICNEIEEYLYYCEKNPDKINQERKLLIKNIVLPTLSRDDVFFDADMYGKCLRYCENNFYPLFPYQKFIYAFVFMYDKDHQTIFNTFFIEMGRGNGKDGFIMPLANFLMTPMHGIEKYHIDIVANSDEQANDSFSVVYDMLQKHKDKFKSMFYWSLTKVINKGTLSKMRYNTSNAKTKDGKQTGAVIFNEYHQYENDDQLKVFKSGLGKVDNPRVFIITTNGNVRGGPLDKKLDECNEILVTGINERGYFPFICRIEKEEDWDKEEKWILSNPSMEYMPTLKRQIKLDYLDALVDPSAKVEFKTKRCNWPARNETHQVTSWDNILRCSFLDIETKKQIRQMPDMANRSCIIGIDFADIRDFASAGVLFKIDGEYIWRQHTWICKSSPYLGGIKFPLANCGEPGFQDFEVVDCQSISADDIADWCVEQASRYNIVKIIMDTYRFGILREKFLERGFLEETKKMPDGQIRMIRKLGAINAIIAPIIQKALTDGQMNYGDSAIMRWYTNNTALNINKLGNISFEKIEPKFRKTDGFMAMTCAMSGEKLLDEIVIQL